MAATELLPVASGADDSDPITVEAGDQIAVGLKTADDASALPGGALVLVMIADDDSQYWQVGKLNLAKPMAVLSVPGTYILRRPATSSKVGAFRAA